MKILVMCLSILLCGCVSSPQNNSPPVIRQYNSNCTLNANLYDIINGPFYINYNCNMSNY